MKAGKRYLKRMQRHPRSDRQASATTTRLRNRGGKSEDPLRTSVLKRVTPAVLRLVEVSPEQQLLEALSTNTGMDALIHLVSGDTAAVEAASHVQDPLREAKARAARKFAGLLAADGGPIGVEDVAKLLRITRAAVDKRRKNGTLIGIEDGGRAIL